MTSPQALQSTPPTQPRTTAPLRDSADVGRAREEARQRRLLHLAYVLAPIMVWMLHRALTEKSFFPAFPSVDPIYIIVAAFFLIMLLSLGLTHVVGGKSPHITYRPEQIDIKLDDVKGLEPLKEEVSRSLDLFLGAKTFRSTMGGTARRGLLFEGTPGTGKTLTAKALAAEAGVPFLFVSATSFQSMYYGATARKIRSYFKELRKAARAEGGAIGFIEEIDAIAMARGGMNSMTPAPSVQANSSIMCCGGLTGLPGAPGGLETTASVSSPTVTHAAMTSEGVGGVVNELLVQMQSFDEPTSWQRVQTKVIDAVNLVLPVARQLPRPRPEKLDILLIAATNRADNLDPALLRPGRFDRRLTFELPDHGGRREIIDYFLAKKSHDDEMDSDERRDALAGVTQGYSPVMIEHLLDEALVNALRRGSTTMDWRDIERARMVTEIGLGQPVRYTEHEQRVIATHEAGHTVVAYLEAPNRRLEMVSIVKRANALGLLAHGDTDDVYTRSSRELRALIRIALGGQAAERRFFGDVTTGPASDLQFATTIGAQMIGAAGMGDTLVSMAAIDGSLTQNLVGRVVSDGEGRRMLESLLTEQRDYVRTLIDENADMVEALRDALLERHELIGHEITDVLGEVKRGRPCTSLSAAQEKSAMQHSDETASSPRSDSAKEPDMTIDLSALEKGLGTIDVDDDDRGVDDLTVNTSEGYELPKRH